MALPPLFSSYQDEARRAIPECLELAQVATIIKNIPQTSVQCYVDVVEGCSDMMLKKFLDELQISSFAGIVKQEKARIIVDQILMCQKSFSWRRDWSSLPHTDYDQLVDAVDAEMKSQLGCDFSIWIQAALGWQPEAWRGFKQGLGTARSNFAAQKIPPRYYRHKTLTPTTLWLIAGPSLDANKAVEYLFDAAVRIFENVPGRDISRKLATILRRIKVMEERLRRLLLNQYGTWTLLSAPLEVADIQYAEDVQRFVQRTTSFDLKAFLSLSHIDLSLPSEKFKAFCANWLFLHEMCSEVVEADFNSWSSIMSLAKGLESAQNQHSKLAVISALSRICSSHPDLKDYRAQLSASHDPRSYEHLLLTSTAVIPFVYPLQNIGIPKLNREWQVSTALTAFEAYLLAQKYGRE